MTTTRYTYVSIVQQRKITFLWWEASCSSSCHCWVCLRSFAIRCTAWTELLHSTECIHKHTAATAGFASAALPSAALPGPSSFTLQNVYTNTQLPLLGLPPQLCHPLHCLDRALSLYRMYTQTHSCHCWVCLRSFAIRCTAWTELIHSTECIHKHTT